MAVFFKGSGMPHHVMKLIHASITIRKDGVATPLDGEIDSKKFSTVDSTIGRRASNGMLDDGFRGVRMRDVNRCPNPITWGIRVFKNTTICICKCSPGIEQRRGKCEYGLHFVTFLASSAASLHVVDLSNQGDYD